MFRFILALNVCLFCGIELSAQSPSPSTFKRYHLVFSSGYDNSDAVKLSLNQVFSVFNSNPHWVQNPYVIPSDYSHYADNSRTHSLFLDISSKVKFAQHVDKRVRFGVTYRGTYSLIYQTGRSEETRTIDTLKSTQTSTEIYVDTTFVQQQSVRVEGKAIKFETSVQLCSRTQKRLHIYGGVGLALAFNFDSQFQLTNYSFSQESFRSSNPTSGSNYSPPVSYISSSNVSKTRDAQSLTLYAPIGIEFRLGKKQPFLRKIEIFVEANFGAIMHRIPVIHSYPITLTTRTFFGLRYELFAPKLEMEKEKTIFG